jgi:hypothetical protein
MRQFTATPTVEELEARIEQLEAVVDAAKAYEAERYHDTWECHYLLPSSTVTFTWLDPHSTTDVTTAISNAINSGHKDIYIPAGIYLVSSMIVTQP